MAVHSRIAWWDVKRWMAMRARRIAAGLLTTFLAGSGFAAYQHYESQAVKNPSPPHQPSGVPTVDPTLPWATPGAPSSPGPIPSDPGAGPDPAVDPDPASTTTPTFASPTQPWPGTNP